MFGCGNVNSHNHSPAPTLAESSAQDSTEKDTSTEERIALMNELKNNADQLAKKEKCHPIPLRFMP